MILMGQQKTKGFVSAIANQLREHLQVLGALQPFGKTGVFYCRKTQVLRDIPLHNPGFVLVVSGKKEVRRGSQVNGSQVTHYQSGQILLFPAGITLGITNEPAPESDYLAVAVTFSPEVLERFSKNYGKELDIWAQQPQFIANASDEFLQLVSQCLQICVGGVNSALMQTHREEGLLLSLAQSGLAGNFFIQQQPSWQQKVSSCLAMDVSRAWRMEDVAARFACSEATLRRRLEDEQCNFRKLLEDVRLTSGLSLLQETDWNILRVAQTVGYESASRFSERFRLRFGLSPQELRLTREVNNVKS
jgi:AraC-like DNA-binding protein